MEREYPEEEFLAPLLKSSERFDRFYFANRLAIPSPILCLVNNEIPPRIRGGIIRRDNQWVLVMGSIPTRGDDHVVAHELGHLLLDARGFPVTRTLPSARQEHSMVSALTNSCLQDPLIEQSLGAFGFNTSKKYREYSTCYRSDLLKDSNPRFPYDKCNLLGLLKHRLWWDLIAPAKPDIHLLLWLRREFPSLAHEVDGLADQISTTDYSNPESMAISLGFLRASLRLEGIISKPGPAA
jgi:hypothetical protein